MKNFLVCTLVCVSAALYGADGAPAVIDDSALTELQGIIQTAAEWAAVPKELIPQLDASLKAIEAAPLFDSCPGKWKFCPGCEWNNVRSATTALRNADMEGAENIVRKEKKRLELFILEKLRCPGGLNLSRLAKAFESRRADSAPTLTICDIEVIVDHFDHVGAVKKHGDRGRMLAVRVVKKWDSFLAWYKAQDGEAVSELGRADLSQRIAANVDMREVRTLLPSCAGALGLKDLERFLLALDWFWLFTSYEQLLNHISSAECAAGRCTLVLSPHAASEALAEELCAASGFDKQAACVVGNDGTAAAVAMCYEILKKKANESFDVLSKARDRLAVTGSELFGKVSLLLDCRSEVIDLLSLERTYGSLSSVEHISAVLEKIGAVARCFEGCKCADLQPDEERNLKFVAGVVLPEAVHVAREVLEHISEYWTARRGCCEAPDGEVLAGGAGSEC